MRHLHRHNYLKAKEIFENLAGTAPAEVADRARVHLRLCAWRLAVAPPAPKTANDYHVLGVTALNAGNLISAIELLAKAQKLQPNREEIRYALAAAHALQGNADTAIEHLKAAIELRPQNRFQARRDEDFQVLAGDPRFQTLVLPTVQPPSRLPS